ncbi:MAG: HD domain-containing protein [Chitinophagaceae bacterium]|nr:HD domain-containing protein [Chitinophagaceae bacterium]
MNYSSLIEQVSGHITTTFSTSIARNLFYHNLKHTEMVVNNAGRIAGHYKLNDRDYFVVIAAAWFHDIGYNAGEAAEHELRGAGMAEEFLRLWGVFSATLMAFRNCILSTSMPQHP